MSSGIKTTHSIEPYTSVLWAQHLSPLGWRPCLSELIDNSLDAGANSIVIHFQPKILTVSDDGKGCDVLPAMFQLGHHSKHASTELGMYGVGLKDAALWLWGETVVASNKGGILRTASLDWERIVKSGEWSLDTEEYEATPAHCEFFGVNQRHGTTILFRRHTRKGCDLPALISDLGYIFSPAIKNGRSIQVVHQKKTFPVPAFEVPPLENVIDVVRDCSGKPFRVRAGVVPEGQSNPKPGFTITYRHRVIKPATSEGCGDFGSARFFGWVELYEGWKLSRNKDELVDDAEELSKLLHNVCLSQLSAASKQARSIDLAGIEADIQTAIESIITQNKKEKRASRSSSTGTVEPKGTPRQRQAAARTQVGDKPFVSAVGSKVKVQFVNPSDFEKRIGWAEINSSGPLISLSLRHPFVNWAQHESNSIALTVLACSVLANHVACSSNERIQQKWFPAIESEQTEERFLKGLALYTSHLGKPSELAVVA